MVFALVVGLGESVRADDSCASILKRSLSARQSLASGDAGSSSGNQLSSRSQQYLRLIEYALEKMVDHAERQRLLQSIHVAMLVPASINVFAQQTSIQGLALNQAVTKMDIVRTLSADWKLVQERLKEILSRHGAETSARDQAEGDTDRVAVYDKAWKILLDGIVNTTPDWQQIGNEWYLAVGSTRGKVYVLKFDLNANDIKGALSVAGEFATGWEVSSSPSWQRIGAEWYLAFGSADKMIYVLKFDLKTTDVNQALIVAGKKAAADEVVSSPSWQQIGNAWYLAVGSHDKKVYVLNFETHENDTQKALKVAGEYSTGSFVSSDPSWQEIESEWYLAIGSDDNKVYVLKFDLTSVDAKQALTVAGEYLTGDIVASSPDWQQIGDQWFLAVGSWDQKVYVLKFDSRASDLKVALSLAGEFLTGSHVKSSPGWQLIRDNWYLAVGSHDKKVYVLKFDSNAGDINKALVVVGEYVTDGNVYSSPSWQKIESDWHLAVGSTDNKVYVLKFDLDVANSNQALTVAHEYLTNGGVYSSPRWQQIGRDRYLAVGSRDNHLHLLKFGKKLKRGER